VISTFQASQQDIKIKLKDKLVLTKLMFKHRWI